MITCSTPSRRLFVFLVAVLTCMALSPLAATADEIDDLLAAGDYAEGEVIAAFRTNGSSTPLTDGGLFQPRSAKPYTVKPLMTVSDTEPQATDDQLRAQSEETLTLKCVTSDTLSTAELMRMLSDDPNVAFVEPNYTLSLTDEDESDTVIDLSTLTDAPISLSSQTDTPAILDLTPLQWGNWANSQTYHAEGFTTNPSINVPNFGATQRGANMDRPITVALLDTAVDYQNPDLINVLYHFTPEQQKTLGCWEYGYKAGNGGTQGNYYDLESVAVGHGTHTAGIIGAEWNGFGTSGVASNVRIVSIDFEGEGNSTSILDAISAFSFVDKFNRLMPKEERIRVTSNSWGLIQSTRAVDAAVRELGEKWNTVSVFSAGNDAKNNDHYERPNSYLESNPYAVIVAMTNGDDTLDEDSEYGVASVDLAAPGKNILSTVTEKDAEYIPDATRSSDPVYMGFDGDDTLPITVSQLYREDNPDLWHDDTVVASDIGTISTNAHVYGTNSLRVDVDPSHAVFSTAEKYGNRYDIQLDIDLTGTDIADRLEGLQGLHLCYGLTGGDESVGIQLYGETTNLVNISHNSGGATTTNAQWTMMDWVMTELGQFDSPIEGEAAPTGVTLRPADDHLIIKLRVGLADGCTTFYIDSLGLGTQTVPYGYKTGTSMACPQVAGAGAVLASQGYEGAELASLMRSKVRIPDPALQVKSGGIFDFNVEGVSESTDSHAFAPDITNVAIDGTTVTITGSRFGKAPGSVDTSRYVVGAALQAAASRVVSWSDDTVVLSLDAPFEGILSVVLYNAAGKWDTQYRFASRSADVYEQDLPYDAPTGDPFVHGDDEGDWEIKGPLVGLGCKLYHLPGYKGHEELEYSYKRMHCFDLKTQTWSELTPLPEWLSDASAVMFNGKIVVEGGTMYKTETGKYKKTFPAGETAEERVYVYDPEKDSWSPASSDGMYLNQTIANENGQLRLVGGSMPNPEQPNQTVPAPVMSYDLTSGAGDEICSMPVAFNNPQVAAKKGSLLIYSDGINFSPKLSPAVYRVKDGEAAELKGALPTLIPATEAITFNTMTSWFTEKGNIPYHAVIAPTSDGYVFVGPPAADGSSDTFVLRDDTDTFEAYGKRSSDDCVFSQAACTYRGRLFVIGASLLEPNNRLFRATAMEVPEYPGDVPCEADPDPEKDPDDTKESDSKSQTKPSKQDNKADGKKTDKKTSSNTSKKTSSTKTSSTGTTATQTATNTAAATSTAANDKPLASTGDTATSPLAVLACGACAATLGVLLRRRES